MALTTAERHRTMHETQERLVTLLPQVARSMTQNGNPADARANPDSGRGAWVIETAEGLHGTALALDACVSYDDPRRLVIDVRLPHGWYQHRPHNLPNPRITVAAGRDPGAIAQAIENRLLPAARDFFRAVADSAKREQDAKTGAVATFERIVAAGRGVVDDGPLSHAPGTQIEIRGAVKAPRDLSLGYLNGYCHADSVRLELCSLPVPVALRVLALLADIRDGSAG